MMKNEDKKDDVSKNEEVKESNQDAQTPVKPLLSKSAILKLLAELVKSYSGVAQLITDYSHSAKLSSTSEVRHKWKLPVIKHHRMFSMSGVSGER